MPGLLGGSPVLNLQAFRSWGAQEWLPLPSSAREAPVYLSDGEEGRQGSPGYPCVRACSVASLMSNSVTH